MRNLKKHYEEEDWQVLWQATKRRLPNGNRVDADKLVAENNKDYYYAVWEYDADGNTVGKVTKAKTVDAAMADVAKRRGGGSAFVNRRPNRR